MSNKEDGGPAFPLGASEYAGHGPQAGMTLRDYFAAKAMQGMLANGDWVARMSDHTGIDPDECTARAAFEVADAMLEARK